MNNPKQREEVITVGAVIVAVASSRLTGRDQSFREIHRLHFQSFNCASEPRRVTSPSSPTLGPQEVIVL